jgi:hypothetical protein
VEDTFIIVKSETCINIYREVLTYVQRFTALSSAATAGREAHTNFVDESICLLADNFLNEVVKIHRP